MSAERVTDEAVKAAWQTFNRHEDGFAPTAMRAAISAALPHLTAEQAETVAGGAVDDHLWCLHIIGPDDVHPAPSKEQAERAATWVNARFSEVKDVLIKAEVIEWPHSPESHARGVAEFSKLWAIPNESKETTEGFVNILETIALDFFSDDVLDQFKPERAAIRAAIAALRQQQPAAAVPDNVTRTAPAKIWLQVDADDYQESRDAAFQSFNDECSWCSESQGGVEIGYIRADLCAQGLASNAGVPEGLRDFLSAKMHHLPVEDQHVLSVFLPAAPSPQETK